jgi:hypothetical protein
MGQVVKLDFATALAQHYVPEDVVLLQSHCFHFISLLLFQSLWSSHWCYHSVVSRCPPRSHIGYWTVEGHLLLFVQSPVILNNFTIEDCCFLHVMPCSLPDESQYFGGPSYLHIQFRQVSHMWEGREWRTGGRIGAELMRGGGPENE